MWEAGLRRDVRRRDGSGWPPSAIVQTVIRKGMRLRRGLPPVEFLFGEPAELQDDDDHSVVRPGLVHFSGIPEHGLTGRDGLGFLVAGTDPTGPGHDKKQLWWAGRMTTEDTPWTEVHDVHSNGLRIGLSHDWEPLH